MADRPFLYLLPGLLCDNFVFAEQTRALANRAIVRVPNFFGFNSISAMAESVLADAPPRFALAGFSMGGRVALQIVRQAPHRVERLALLDTGTEERRPGEEIIRQQLVDLACTQGMAALAARWLPPMLHPAHHQDAAIVGPLTAMVCRATPGIFENQVRALLARPDATKVLASIDCPTLVGCGRQDTFSPLSQHEAMAEAIKDAVLEVFENAGHFAPVEAPSAVSSALLRWLDQH